MAGWCKAKEGGVKGLVLAKLDFRSLGRTQYFVRSRHVESL